MYMWYIFLCGYTYMCLFICMYVFMGVHMCDITYTYVCLEASMEKSECYWGQGYRVYRLNYKLGLCVSLKCVHQIRLTPLRECEAPG